jgi:hypothetical protein
MAVRALISLAGLSACAVASADEANGWDWRLEPYVWAASIGTDLRTMKPPTDNSADTSFSDILDKLDGVFMGRVEGRGDRYGAFVDFIYLGIAQDHQFRVVSTETDLDTRVADVAFSWRPGADRDRGLDVYAGGRFIDIDLTTRFTPTDPELQPRTLDVETSFLDLLLGARYTWQGEGAWGVTVHGDASGGDTDGTWNTSAMGHYRTGNGAWLFGYRYMQAKLGADNADVRLVLNGPVFAYSFRF